MNSISSTASRFIDKSVDLTTNKLEVSMSQSVDDERIGVNELTQ